MSKILYKKDSKGKLRVLKMWVEGDTLVQESGLVGGALTPHRSKCAPKNVGRANATTAEQQAAKELESKYIKKIKEDYFTTAEEAENTTVIRPMLAKVYEDHVAKIDWSTNVWIQPKLDGMRALLHLKNGAATLVSRIGNQIDSCPHIVNALTGHELPEMILDGELYAHGYSFQENMRLTKKHRPGESGAIRFHAYDMISEEPFNVRYGKMHNIVRSLTVWLLQNDRAVNVIQPVYTTKTGEVTDEIAVINMNTGFLQQGYEGTIIRWGTSPYKVKGRSENLLKYKHFRDELCLITGVIPFERDPTQGKFECVYEGKPFTATPRCSHVGRKEILANPMKWIHSYVEIRFFELTDTGVPRHGVAYVNLDKI